MDHVGREEDGVADIELERLRFGDSEDTAAEGLLRDELDDTGELRRVGEPVVGIDVGADPVARPVPEDRDRRVNAGEGQTSVRIVERRRLLGKAAEDELVVGRQEPGTAG